MMKANVKDRVELPRKQTRRKATAVLGLISLALFSVFRSHSWMSLCPRLSSQPDVAAVQQCSIDNLKSDLSFLDNAKPITADEFLERRDRLAQALAVNQVDAFVLEPGYTFQYVVPTQKQSAADCQILWQYFPSRLGAVGA